MKSIKRDWQGCIHTRTFNQTLSLVLFWIFCGQDTVNNTHLNNIFSPKFHLLQALQNHRLGTQGRESVRVQRLCHFYISQMLLWLGSKCWGARATSSGSGTPSVRILAKQVLTAGGYGRRWILASCRLEGIERHADVVPAWCLPGKGLATQTGWCSRVTTRLQ